MEKTEKWESFHSDIVHVMSNQIVKIVNYDKRTGQVSYTREDSNALYTCYDYEIASLKGIDHLRSVLVSAASNTDSRNIQAVFT